MAMLLKLLEWDTHFFGYKIGQITNDGTLNITVFKDLIQAAKEQQFKLLYIKSKQKEPILTDPIGAFNIVLADKKVTYCQQLDRTASFNSNSNIQLFSGKTLTPKLLDISLQSGVFSRFAVDPNFKNNEFEKLYTEWIKKSVSGEIAKEVWVSTDEQNEINGLITLGIKNKIADIGLLAVDANSRGQNLGKKLVETAKARAISWGEKKLQVVTQLDNKQACNFYEKCGFQTENIEYIYHIWL